MSYSHYERLSALDSMFLDLEDENVSMHVGAVGIFSHGSLANERGQVDFETLGAFVEGALDDVPRFRQRLKRVPIFDHPVWVDDHRFNINYHLRHSALPAPGTIRQLKRLAGRLMSQKLDRGKPLWEMSVVDGLEGGRFAVVFKAHHCMVDGIAGIDLIANMLRLEPVDTVEPRSPWPARPRPQNRRLFRDEVIHRTIEPLTTLASAPGALTNPGKTLSRLLDNAGELFEVVTANLQPALETPFNDDLGQHRRFDWLSMDLSQVREIAKAHQATINDVVLTIVAGAIGQYLRGRGVEIGPNTVFRALVPVNTRKQDERGQPGNHVVNYAVALPIHESAPRQRLASVVKTMSELKSSSMVHGAELLEEISDFTFSGVIVELVKFATEQRAYNMVVTNVPGPQFPLYLLGAELEEIYPVVPLFSNQTFGIALFSYDGRLCWGFNADWDKVPDLHDIVELVADELKLLLRSGLPKARRKTSSQPQRKRARKARTRRRAN